jgi:Phage protein Gp19/Gp15/Gp42
MTYATATDVTDRWGRVASPEELTLIGARLGDVERMISRRFTKVGLVLSDEITAGNLDQDDVIQVEADAVLRLARNPDGFQSETDGQYTYQLLDGLSTGTLEILPSEWDILGITTDTGMFVLVPNPIVAT